MLSLREPILQEDQIEILLHLLVRQLGPFGPGTAIVAHGEVTPFLRNHSNATRSIELRDLNNEGNSSTSRSLAFRNGETWFA